MIGILFWLCVLLIFYTYLGYILTLVILARFYPVKIYETTDLPTVTLLIAAYNEELIIGSKLENALSLNYPRERLQILVAADGSNDRTVEIVNSYKEREIEISFNSTRKGKMAAINQAMALAYNEIVVFSDANNFYAADTLLELVKPFSDPYVGGVSGAKSVGEDQSLLAEADSLYWKYESIIKSQETRMGSTIGVSGEILAIRRNLFIPPPSTIINDDMFIALTIIRKGYNIIYMPSARSYERMTQSENDELVRRTRIFAGLYQTIRMSFSLLPFRRPTLIWQIVSHKYLRAVVPFAMIGAGIANLLALVFVKSVALPEWLILDHPYNFIFLIIQVCFYLLAFLGMKMKPRGKLGKFLYIPTFLVNSNLAAILGFLRYFNGKQTVLWKKAAR